MVTDRGADDGDTPGDRDVTPAGPSAADRAAADRLVFFSDAVAAIALTLLAIDLPVPEGRDARELLASLGADSLAYLTFLISFLVIGAHWQAHHSVFRYLGRVDRTFLHLDFLWLLVIVITPFLTEVIREGDLNVVRFGLYALAQALLLLTFEAMQRHAARRGLFVAGTPHRITRESRPDQYLGVLGFLVSIPLFPLIGAWAFTSWWLLPNLPPLVRAVRRRRASGSSPAQ